MPIHDPLHKLPKCAVIEEEDMIRQKCIINFIPTLHCETIFHRTVATVTEVAYDILLWAWCDREVPKVISFLRSC